MCVYSRGRLSSAATVTSSHGIPVAVLDPDASQPNQHRLIYRPDENLDDVLFTRIVYVQFAGDVDILLELHGRLDKLPDPGDRITSLGRAGGVLADRGG